jgi:hypothetical protein
LRDPRSRGLAEGEAFLKAAKLSFAATTFTWEPFTQGPAPIPLSCVCRLSLRRPAAALIAPRPLCCVHVIE